MACLRSTSNPSARCAAVCAASTRARARAAISLPRRLLSVPQDRDHRLGIVHQLDLDARLEQRLQSSPAIGQDRRAAGGSLEQAHARRPSGRDHVRARDVQRVAAGSVKGGMTFRRHVLEPRDVGRPFDRGGILRAGDDEGLVRQTARRLDQQAFERRLAVVAVGPQVAEIVAARQVHRPVARGIDRAVERARRRRAVMPFEQIERRSAGEREVEVVAGDERRREILVVTAPQLRQRYRRVDIVEGAHASGRPLHVGSDGDPFGHVGPDHHGVRRRDHRAVGLKLFERIVEHEIAIGRGIEIARVAVPRLVALQEGDAMAAFGEGRQQRAVGRGVAVAPRTTTG